MTPLEAEKNENATRLRKIYFEKYSKAGGKKQKPKFKVGDTVKEDNFIEVTWKTFLKKYLPFLKSIHSFPLQDTN